MSSSVCLINISAPVHKALVKPIILPLKDTLKVLDR